MRKAFAGIVAAAVFCVGGIAAAGTVTTTTVTVRHLAHHVTLKTVTHTITHTVTVQGPTVYVSFPAACTTEALDWTTVQAEDYTSPTYWADWGAWQDAESACNQALSPGSF
jgi:hypothetical protein